MEVKAEIGQIKDLIDSQRRLLILLSEDSLIGAIAAGLALQESLIERGKEVDLIASDKARETGAGLKWGPAVKKELPAKSLVVSIDYQGTPVEKINYETEGSKLNLTFSPYNANFDPSQVSFQFSSLNYDLLFTIGCQDLNHLSSMVQAHLNDLKKLPLINLDIHTNNQLFGQLNLVDSSFGNLVELACDFLDQLKLPFSKTAAQNLLIGLKQETHNFTKSVKAQTFKTAAFLVEKGAMIEAPPSSAGSQLDSQESTPQPWLR